VNGAISGLTIFLLVLVGMTQNGSIPKKPGYIASGILAAIIFGLAIVRYKQRKARGE
jgi:hypothetical protein